MDYFKFLFCLTIWINLQYEYTVDTTQCGVQGHDIELKCVIRSNDKAIVWMKENDILSKDIHILIEELKGKIVVTGNHDIGEYHLTIAALEYRDAGRYYCQLSDDPTRVQVQLIIIDFVKYTQCGILGQDVELKCGTPKYVEGTWINGDVLISSGKTILQEVKPDDFRVRLRITGNHDKGEFHLTISSIKTSDEGTYICERLDGDHVEVQLYLREGAEQSTFTVPGSQVELYCSLRAQRTEGKIQWLIIGERDTFVVSINDNILDNLPLEQAQRLEITGDHNVGEYNLMINDVRMSDQSRYMCIIDSYKDIQNVQQLIVIGPSTNNVITSTTSALPSTYSVISSTINGVTSEGDVFTSTDRITTLKVVTTYDGTTSPGSTIVSTKESSEDNTVVGVVVGTTVPVVATIAVIIIIVVLIRRKKTTKDKTERNLPTKHTNDVNSYPDMYYNLDKSSELPDPTYETLNIDDDSCGYEELGERLKDCQRNVYENGMIGSNVA